MSKNIVICCDGTWSTPDHRDRGQISPTNVVHMRNAIASYTSDGREQVIYYHRGLGTTPMQYLLGGAFSVGITEHIKNIYGFLVDNYQEGDKIFFFGFSRGAYTVRSVAGLIHNSGLLYKQHGARLKESYDLYRRRDPASKPSGEEAKQFRQNYSREGVKIKFMGVWDTVGSLGIPIGTVLPYLTRHYYQFHDVKLSKGIEHAYQAIAIDEQRKNFEPTLWEKQEDTHGQTLEQVWFAGTHSNVGGGYQDSGLSNIAFLWLKEKAEACGLAFDPVYIRNNICEDLNQNICGELRDSKTGLFSFLGSSNRPIGVQKNGYEQVHTSAILRYEATNLSPAYRPENLEKWLSPTGLAAVVGR